MTLKKCEDWNITKKCVRFKLSIEALVEIGMLVVRHSNIIINISPLISVTSEHQNLNI